MKSISVFLVLAAILCTCIHAESEFPELDTFSITNNSFRGTVRFKKLTSTTGFKILLEDSTGFVTDQTVFRYVPYRFDTADVNQDGKTELVVGLLKATRFDPGVKKRLFILRIDQSHLRPMWLGSKVCQELIDFKAVDNGQIQTLERARAGGYDIGRYYWQGFGLTLEKYVHHETSFTNAHKIFWQ